MKLKTALTSLAGLAMAGLFAASAVAGETEIRKAIESGGARVKAINPAPVKGLMEVVVEGGGILYADPTGKYVVAGSIFDAATKENLTAKRDQELNKIDFSKLPLDKAVKRVRGKGERVLVTFEDVKCGYCRALNAEIEKLDNVTVYTFLIGILSPDSGSVARDVWCAEDRSAALSAALRGETVPAGSEACRAGSPVDANQALAASLRINGTPAIVFKDGARSPGMMPATEIEKRLR